MSDKIHHWSEKPFQFCIISEKSEGLCAKLDFRGITPETAAWLQHQNLAKYGLEEAAWSVCLQTRFGLERLFEYAFLMHVGGNLSGLPLQIN